MTLAELNPDIALKALLADLQVQTNESAFVDVKAYAQGETPNVGLDAAFVSVGLNGLIETVTHPIGMFRGNVAVSINVMCYDDGTANDTQISQLVGKIEQSCFYKTSQGFYFEPAAYAVIMPTTTDTTTGYATTILNIKWRTIHNDANSLNL